MPTYELLRQPGLHPGVELAPTPDGMALTSLDGRRHIELDLDDDRRDALTGFLRRLQDRGVPQGEIRSAFPGPAEELLPLLDALDELGMLAERDATAPAGMTGRAAYGHLRRQADAARVGLTSPLYRALLDGTAHRDHLVGYAVEYWHITHLCPRALAPVLARDDVKVETWQKLMSFYLSERSHDRMLENSLRHVGIEREQLLRTQPLPATAGIMASLGLYAYQFPLALVATLFPMEEPELEFLELFRLRSTELGLPDGFLAPIVAHSDVNDEEAHDAVSLDLLADVDFIGHEELLECVKAVCDVIEQRARLDAEIMAWWPDGGLRDFSTRPYVPEAGRRLSCALPTSWA